MPRGLGRDWTSNPQSNRSQNTTPTVIFALAILAPAARLTPSIRMSIALITTIQLSRATKTSAPRTLAMRTVIYCWAHSEHGICRVLCFSPKHNLTIARMEIAALEKVVERWAQEYQQLGDLEDIRHVQIFENHGIQMGCSNPHPHCQIWAKETIPQDALTRSINQLQYVEHHNSNLLLDYLNEEMAREERILSHNNHFVWLVPFWAVWPFETMVIPIAHHPHINSLSADERLSLASMLKKIGIVYDNLFQCDFPYSLGIHQSPTGTNTAYSAWQMHLSYYPPLLRSATVRKHMVGYELCAMPQRDISPEQAAARLREISDTVHFMDR